MEPMYGTRTVRNCIVKELEDKKDMKLSCPRTYTHDEWQSWILQERNSKRWLIVIELIRPENHITFFSIEPLKLKKKAYKNKKLFVN
jgi:hypothetical protein